MEAIFTLPIGNICAPPIRNACREPRRPPLSASRERSAGMAVSAYLPVAASPPCLLGSITCASPLTRRTGSQRMMPTHEPRMVFRLRPSVTTSISAIFTLTVLAAMSKGLWALRGKMRDRALPRQRLHQPAERIRLHEQELVTHHVVHASAVDRRLRQ